MYLSDTQSSESPFQDWTPTSLQRTTQYIVVPKFFTFGWSLGWVDKFRGLYVHSYSWGGDWIVFSTVPTPRRLGHGPGSTLHKLLRIFSTKDCGCQQMADKYDIGLVDKKTVINFLSVKVPYPIAWTLVSVVDYVWKKSIRELSPSDLHRYDNGNVP